MWAASLPAWVASTLLLGLRLAPSIAFAPPFTLVRMPLLFRLLLGLGLSAGMVGSIPGAMIAGTDLATLLPAAARELALGILFVLALQLLFGALYLAGRTIDIQAGVGLALLIDPTTRSQTPLVGTLFAYAAGAIFFALGGHLALLQMVAATLHVIPLGSWSMPHGIARLALFATTLCSMALGFAGAIIATLFLMDIAIAFLSRTVPQLNVLVLGVQVKTLVLLLALPLAFGLGGALLVRMITTTIEAIPGLV